MNTQDPLVSIIIPTFNRAHLIGETLDSVLAQTYQNWECIIVDDGSSDNTDEVVGNYVNKDPRFNYCQRPDTHKPGGNGARNYGFEVSSGEYVQWFDSDDLMLEGFIEEKLKLFDSEHILFTICSGFFYENNTKGESHKIIGNTNLFEDYVKWKIQVFINSVLFRKHFLIDKELFNEKIIKNQEIELFSRLFFNIPDSTFALINAPLFLYRRHENTKSCLSNNYRKDFSESATYVYIENFKRSILINNRSLAIYLYKKCIKLLFSALQNKHQKNIDYILNEFKVILYKNNKIVYWKLWLFVGKLKIKSQRIKDHFKYLKLNLNER